MTRNDRDPGGAAAGTVTTSLVRDWRFLVRTQQRRCALYTLDPFTDCVPCGGIVTLFLVKPTFVHTRRVEVRHCAFLLSTSLGSVRERS